MNRCRAMSLRTDNVRFLELISYDASTNELTTKLISDGQSLYNALWNGTSLSARILGKELDRGVVRSRMREIGAWLRLYHDSSDHAGAFEEVAEHLNEDLERKVATVRQNELVSEYLLTRIETFCRIQFSQIRDPLYRESNHVRLCRVQGDFIASNMLTDPQWKIVVGDFADTHIGASTEDVGRFCEQLLALSRCGVFRGEVFSEAIREFLQGYGVDGLYFEKSPFCKAIIFLNGLISAISEMKARPFIARQLLTRYELKRLVRATLGWIALDLGKSARSE